MHAAAGAAGVGVATGWTPKPLLLPTMCLNSVRKVSVFGLHMLRRGWSNRMILEYWLVVNYRCAWMMSMGGGGG